MGASEMDGCIDTFDFSKMIYIECSNMMMKLCKVWTKTMIKRTVYVKLFQIIESYIYKQNYIEILCMTIFWTYNYIKDKAHYIYIYKHMEDVYIYIYVPPCLEFVYTHSLTYILEDASDSSEAEILQNLYVWLFVAWHLQFLDKPVGIATVSSSISGYGWLFMPLFLIG